MTLIRPRKEFEQILTEDTSIELIYIEVISILYAVDQQQILKKNKQISGPC